MFEFVAIVGGSRYPRLEEVYAYVATLPRNAILVTSSSRGVDSIAAVAARERGIGVLIFASAVPDYDRRIADICDRLVVFGREQRQATVDLVSILGKPVEIFAPNGVRSR